MVRGIAGGLLAGGCVGLTEAVYLLWTSGVPDLTSPVYALVLYGLIGACGGLVGGLVRSDGVSAGAVAGATPLLLFVGAYLTHKVVYAEQGVPILGWLVLLAVVGGIAAGLWTLGQRLGERQAAGMWTALVAVAGMVSLIPIGSDPRDSFAGPAVPPALASAPDVLVIAVDTLRADHLGAYGKEGEPSPVIDSIAADGIVFESAFAHASWTRSSFASLWSSRIPSSHSTQTKASRLPDDVELLSEVLSDAGVTTGSLVNNINVSSTFNFDQGWHSFLYESPDYPLGATESVFGLTLYKVVHKLRERLGGSKHVETFYQPVEVLTADATRFIEANQASRWLLSMHLMEPHDPFFEHPYLEGTGSAIFNGVGFARAEVESPRLEDAAYLEATYTREITHMDNGLAPFVQWLKDTGRYDDMMIVLTADHGEEFGEHGGFWHGTTLYDEQLHVPLIVKLPGNAHAGTRVSWQARLIDVAPTITSAMGLDSSEQWEGVDLMSKLEVAALDGACAAYRHPAEGVVVAEQDFEGNVLSAIRERGSKLILANEGNPRGLPTRELFDVIVDPAEQHAVDAVACSEGGLDGRLNEERDAVDAVDAAAADTLNAEEQQQLRALGYIE